MFIAYFNFFSRFHKVLLNFTFENLTLVISVFCYATCVGKVWVEFSIIDILKSLIILFLSSRTHNLCFQNSLFFLDNNNPKIISLSLTLTFLFSLISDFLTLYKFFFLPSFMDIFQERRRRKWESKKRCADNYSHHWWILK